jgi:hypothetical protein
MIVLVSMVTVTNLYRFVPVSVPKNTLTYSDAQSAAWRNDQS